MGKRSCSQKKSAALLDSDDIDYMASSSSSVHVGNETGPSEVWTPTSTLLDRCLDDLYEKRGSTREKALSYIIESFNRKLQLEFIETKFVTLLHLCLNSIKKGSAEEVGLASHAIGLLALTVGLGEKAREILEESLSPISVALRIQPETAKLSLLQCLAVITFVGARDDPEQTEKSMDILWRVAHPKLCSNMGSAKSSEEVTMMAVSSWSFLLAAMDSWAVNHKSWQESITYLCTLLDSTLHMAAGEALAIIFEIGSLAKFSCIDEDEENSQGLRSRVVDQMRGVSVEASGKGSMKKEGSSQRHTFGDILEFIENGSTWEISVSTGGGTSLHTTSWAQRVQLSFLKHFLEGGFAKHMKENQFLHQVFGITPKKKCQSGADNQLWAGEKESQSLHYVPNKKFPSGADHRMTAGEKRIYKSPNSALNKARTKQLNRQRTLAQGMNTGYFGVGLYD